MDRVSNTNIQETSKISTFLTTVNLIKLFFDYATLILPSFFADVRNINAFVGMLISSFIFIWSTHELSIIEDSVRKKRKDKTSILSFSSLVKKILGNVGKIIFQVAYIITVILLSVIYIFLIKFILFDSYTFMKNSEINENEIKNPSPNPFKIKIISVVVFSIVFYGLTFIRSPKLKSIVNIFGMVVVISCMIMILSIRPNNDSSLQSKFFNSHEFDPLLVLKAISIFSIFFAHKILAFEFHQEIENRKKFLIANSVACIFAAVLNSIFAAICAISFFKNGIEGVNIVFFVKNNKKDAKLSLMIALLYSFNLCLSLTMLLNSFVGIVKGFFVRKKDRREMKDAPSDNSLTKKSFNKEFIIKSVFVLIVCGSGILFEADKIIGILILVTFNIFLPLLGFVLPGIMLIKLFRQRNLFAMLRGIILIMLGFILPIIFIVSSSGPKKSS